MNGERISELLDRGTLLGQVFTPVHRTAPYFCRTLIYRGTPLGGGVDNSASRSEQEPQDSYEHLRRLCPPHHGPGMVASTSFEAALLVPEPTVVTM